MGAPLQALEIMFEAQRKRINERITRKKKLSNFKNAFFSSFLLFGPLLL
jgi:hypothetical protein